MPDVEYGVSCFGPSKTITTSPGFLFRKRCNLAVWLQYNWTTLLTTCTVSEQLGDSDAGRDIRKLSACTYSRTRGPTISSSHISCHIHHGFETRYHGDFQAGTVYCPKNLQRALATIQQRLGKRIVIQNTSTDG